MISNVIVCGDYKNGKRLSKLIRRGRAVAENGVEYFSDVLILRERDGHIKVASYDLPPCVSIIVCNDTTVSDFLLSAIKGRLNRYKE